MVNVRLLIIVLGHLFVMHGARDFPSALAQDVATPTNGLSVNDRKESIDDHGVIRMRKLWLQGRKIAAQLLWKEYEKDPKGMDELETWKISGASRSGGKYNFEGKSTTEASEKIAERYYGHQDHDQKNINMLDSKILRPASFGIPRSKPAVVALSNSKQMQPQDFKTVKTIASLESSSMSENFVSQEPLNSGRKDETQRLLTATKEIENLMQKDYKGLSKPRRKPPINNHEPRH